MDDNKKDNQNKPEMTDDAMEKSQMSRRKFIRNSSYTAGGLIAGGVIGGLIGIQNSNEPTTNQSKEQDKIVNHSEARMFFSRFEDFVVLEQATERIYPEDDNGPGAIELGVPYFIDKQLAGSWGRNADDYRLSLSSGPDASIEQSHLNRGEIFLAGLRKMNQLSHKHFDTSFDKAEEDQQIEILQDFEEGKVDMKEVNSSSFFMLLRESTLEGAYSDPLYGGNRNMEGWKMKEYPGPVPSYADIIEEDKFVKKEPISLTDYQQKS